jgi:DNA-directed RNA polymerase subunit RPC12/RpoP
MQTKRFSKNDSGFICINCKKKVEPLGYTSRNHCPHCLFSLHLDIMPGDRLNNCNGILEPIQSELNPKKGFVIIFKCRKCGAVTKNKAAKDDNKDLLIALTNKF